MTPSFIELFCIFQGRGEAEEFAQPVPAVEAAQTETLEYCCDRKGQKGDGWSRTVYEKMMVFYLVKLLFNEAKNWPKGPKMK